MTISVGDKLPDLDFNYFADGQMQAGKTGDLLGTGNVVLFAVPGAFTPTCNDNHFPGYLENLEAFQRMGVSKIVCTSVNDPFVMAAWQKQLDPENQIAMLPDGNAAFAEAVGLTMDASGFGLGTRSKRYAMLIENGVVKSLLAEQGGELEQSSAENAMKHIRTAWK